MNLPYRIDLLVRLGEYMVSDDPSWQQAKERAGQENGWFIPEFVDLAAKNIARQFLQKEILADWIAAYQPGNQSFPRPGFKPKTIGIIMAGNIPLVGFHDLLCMFLSGHNAAIRTSSKDIVLIKHLAQKLKDWSEKANSEDPAINEVFLFSDMLKGCDAYIATGSNNSSRYFDYYFGKYAHIIRRNRTAVAILTGDETLEELGMLADDVYQFFGLGCRNVTKIYVPESYDFIPLLEAFRKYSYLADHHKYKNNYDYNLALHILNKKYYMTNDSILLVEEKALFSPITQLNYEFYTDKEKIIQGLEKNSELQCMVGKDLTPFGSSQSPRIDEYADGVDTMRFVSNL